MKKIVTIITILILLVFVIASFFNPWQLIPAIIILLVLIYWLSGDDNNKGSGAINSKQNARFSQLEFIGKL